MHLSRTADFLLQAIWTVCASVNIFGAIQIHSGDRLVIVSQRFKPRDDGSPSGCITNHVCDRSPPKGETKYDLYAQLAMHCLFDI